MFSAALSRFKCEQNSLRVFGDTWQSVAPGYLPAQACAMMPGHASHHGGRAERAMTDDGMHWKALEAFQPEFALIDVGMPKLNGLQVAAMTRAAPWAQSTTLVALTGWGQEGDRQAALAAGFHYHFVKPVDVDSLLRVLLSTPPSSPAWN